MKIGDLIMAENPYDVFSDEEIMGIIVGFIYENELAEMAEVYFPVENYKGYIPVEMIKVID
tara:strand:- start:450 stop:632 length:183 start_codon:yes stop_codon:yes gene_type:complete